MRIFLVDVAAEKPPKKGQKRHFGRFSHFFEVFGLASSHYKCCWAPKSHWKQAGYRKGALRRLEDFDMPNMDFLAFFSSFLDIVYDPLHCIALVLSHAVLHAIYPWVREHWPTRVP